MTATSFPHEGTPPNNRAEEDRALFSRYLDQRDPVDRDALVERFLPLARQLARRYQRPEEPFDDIFQVACFGLVNAVERYDLDRGVAFSSYAVPTIAGEIMRHFRDRTWAVRVPRDLQDLALRVERTARDATVRLGRAPSVAEVATATGLAVEQVIDAMEAASAYRASSLDIPPAGAEEDPRASFGDSLGAADKGFAGAELRADLGALMRALTRRDRLIIRLRFEDDLTQAEIGARLGISQMQVSRLLRKAIAKLRQAAAVADGTAAAAGPLVP
jgi:RNA polymerase sigma-B factor